jgi:hypothetical protein
MIHSEKKYLRRVRLTKIFPGVLASAIALSAILPLVAAVPAPRYLYRTELIQATPGKLLELIDLYKQKAAFDKQAGDEPALWMRHSQGDRWDLLRLIPMQSYGRYYSPERIASRERAAADAANVAWLPRMSNDVAWEEDIIVKGPPLEPLRDAFAAGGLFHVEMFESLPDKRADLYHEREMENAYSAALGQPENFIFIRDQGAAWDIYSIGVFRDIKHFASSADATPEAQAAAAKAAGFTSPSDIGPYLRTLIRLHRDTLAVAIK